MSARCGACAGALGEFWYELRVTHTNAGAAIRKTAYLCELCFVDCDPLVRAYVAAGERKDQAR